jgi:hypothetical protein
MAKSTLLERLQRDHELTAPIREFFEHAPAKPSPKVPAAAWVALTTAADFLGEPARSTARSFANSGTVGSAS